MHILLLHFSALNQILAHHHDDETEQYIYTCPILAHHDNDETERYIYTCPIFLFNQEITLSLLQKSNIIQSINIH